MKESFLQAEAVWVIAFQKYSHFLTVLFIIRRWFKKTKYKKQKQILLSQHTLV